MDQLPGLGDVQPSLEAAANALLEKEWAAVQDSTAAISDDVAPEIRDIVKHSKTLTYRYVLPTQLLAKAVNPSLDCRAIQASAPLQGAFDARTLCHKVIVPFDKRTEDVLGGSPEPYANNPIRIPAITNEARAAQKDKAGFDDLCAITEYAQANPHLGTDLLRIALMGILERLATVRVIYPVPNRVSQLAAMNCVVVYLKDRTGGIRLQVVSVALFRAIGLQYKCFSSVRSNDINASDKSTGSAADLECIGEDDSVVLAVEVKDRPLALLHVQVKLPRLRDKAIKEAIFITQGGIVEAEKAEVLGLMQKEFSSGQNIYRADFYSFMENQLMLFGEKGRRDFLKYVGEELDKYKADVAHRQRWRDLLVAI